MPPVKFSNFASILSATEPRVAPTAAFNPPVAKAFNGSCPYTTATVADFTPPSKPFCSATSTVLLNPALAMAGLANLDVTPATLPVA